VQGPASVFPADSVITKFGPWVGAAPPAGVRLKLYVGRFGPITTDPNALARLDLPANGMTFTYGYCPVAALGWTDRGYPQDFGITAGLGWSTLTTFAFFVWQNNNTILASRSVQVDAFIMGA
jgi:hypothetical protein